MWIKRHTLWLRQKDLIGTWTSENNCTGFLSCSAHWVDTNFNLKDLALNMKNFNDAYTAQNIIAKALQELSSMW